MPKIASRPYLIAKDEDGSFRITVRTTRFNSQGYPLVSSKMLDGSFQTVAAARSHLRTQFVVQPGEIALK